MAVDWELIEETPFRKSKLIRLPEQTPLYFSKDDFRVLIETISTRWLQELVIFAVNTGMRRGEIVNLKWENVDFIRKLVLVRNSQQFTTKSKRERTIPLNRRALHTLKERSGSSGYVFTDAEGLNIRDKRLTRLFAEAVRRAGINPRLHFHSLRHTFASWLVQDGVSLYEVQKLLGHSNIAVTQVYSHLQPETLHSTVNRITIALT